MTFKTGCRVSAAGRARAATDTGARTTAPRIALGRVAAHACLLALAAVTWCPHARADGPRQVEGVLALGTGIEGADPGTGNLYWHRARTRMTLGGEWGGSETPFSMGLFGVFELERSGSFGLAFHGRATLPWGLTGFVGPILVWRPRTLLGARAGGGYIFRFTDELALSAELGLASFPLGSDRPTPDSVLTWLTADLGFRVGF